MKSIQQNIFSVSEVELVYRKKIEPTDRHKITSSSEAYDVFLANWDMNKIDLVEQFAILLLDRNNACLGMSTVSTGGVSSCIADPKLVFGTALKARACGIVLAHNHPSGSLHPSDADELVTHKFRQSGNILEIPVKDHLIITRRSYFSFGDEGLLPF